MYTYLWQELTNLITEAEDNGHTCYTWVTDTSFIGVSDATLLCSKPWKPIYAYIQHAFLCWFAMHYNVVSLNYQSLTSN